MLRYSISKGLARVEMRKPRNAQAQNAPPAYCDACRHTPSAEIKARCMQTRTSSCSSVRCDWLVQFNRTFGVQYGPGTLGWGNSFSYVRNLHEFAALLGRRLLLHPVRAYLSMVTLVVLATGRAGHLRLEAPRALAHGGRLGSRAELGPAGYRSAALEPRAPPKSAGFTALDRIQVSPHGASSLGQSLLGPHQERTVC